MELKPAPFPLDVSLPFYGVDNHRFKLGDAVYEAVEDPDDGYRSYLGSVEVRDGAGIFFPNPVDTVRAVKVDRPAKGYVADAFIGYQLVGADGHVWLEFGTDNHDDWYPVYRFRYTPRT